MNTMLISLGLELYTPPHSIPDRPKPGPKSNKGKPNKVRIEETYKSLYRVLKKRIMSTRDVAHFMGIERATAAAYLAKLRDDDGLVEVVGKTLHAGDSSEQFLWRIIE